MKLLFKIFQIPFIFTFYLVCILAGLVFPTTLIMLLSFASLLVQPLIWFINLGLTGSSKIRYDFPLIEATDSLALNNLLGLTIILWVPFFGAYVYFNEETLLF